MTLPRFGRRALRLSSGLVLFTYVATHLINHALGLISVARAESGLRLALLVWHSVPGSVLLYGAAGVHLALAFDALYGRRTLRMAPLDLTRIVMGFGIPSLLIGHAVGTRLAWELYQQSPQYARVVWSLWTTDSQGRQLALLVPGWLHGCFGVHIAFSHRPLYRRLHRPLFAAALLLPVLGGLGFLAMGKELAADLSNREHLAALTELPSAAHVALLQLRDALLGAYVLAGASVLLARAVRYWVERRGGKLVGIQFPRRLVHVPRGWSVLEASRSHQLPHVAVCGGRARCSTCRVLVTSGARSCPPPEPLEQATLQRIHARAGVRLACQLRPRGDIGVVPLLGDATRPVPGTGLTPTLERDVALVCVAWRNAESDMQHMLAQDSVFLTASFAETTARQALATGGTACNIAPHEVTLAFDTDSHAACRQALLCAHGLETALADLADSASSEFGVAPTFTLCVHVGAAVLAELGGATPMQRIVAGPAVQTMGRLRAAVQRHRSHSAVSLEVLRRLDIRPESLSDAQLDRADAAPGGEFVALGSLHGLRQMLSG